LFHNNLAVICQENVAFAPNVKSVQILPFFLPTAEQKLQLAKFFGSCRFVYNLALECKMQAWASARKHLTCIDLANQMKELKDTEAE
jgi:predicted secreted protein